MSALAALAPNGVFADAVDFISLQNRMLTFTRGIIDTRSLVYLASIAILCVLVSFRSLESRKWS
jgi:ABC-2 type transport system permease protein